MTHEERVSAVAALGFTERQAAFLVQVMLHSGVCLGRQYCTFARHRARAEDGRLLPASLTSRRLRDALSAAGTTRPASFTSTTRRCTTPSGSATSGSASGWRWRRAHRAPDDARPCHRPSGVSLARGRAGQGRAFPHDDVAPDREALPRLAFGVGAERHDPVLPGQVADRGLAGWATARVSLPPGRARCRMTFACSCAATRNSCGRCRPGPCSSSCP